MRHTAVKELVQDDRGAVAATYALSLTALILIAGVGFDYGRLAAMDSELQNGADQAALAGATQLNGASGACSRASAAAVSLVTNTTVVANSSHAVTIPSEAACDATGSVKFWQDKNRATAATSDANAHFIEVTAAARSVDYAFTPITGLLRGSAVASAMAGLGSSVCKVPPVFMCNPDQGGDAAFTIANYIGKGIRLIANSGGSTYGSGNFGYLEASGGNGAQAISQALGRTEIPGDCISADSIMTKTGVQVSVLDALNTRFDVYANGLNQACGNSNELCPPSNNSRKDLMHKGNTNNCAFANGNGSGWHEAPRPYFPASGTTALTQAQINATSPMGYPRDMCHAISATGACSGGQIGTGIWDRNAYFKTNSANYASNFDVSGAFGTATPTRYQVYKYEALNAGTRLQNQTDAGNTSRPQPYCRTPGIAVGGTAIDRRVLSVAVVNCTGANLTAPLAPVKWVDVFLTEPSVNRRNGNTHVTEQSDVYVEVIGATTLGGGTTAAQQIRRDVPYLVR